MVSVAQTFNLKWLGEKTLEFDGMKYVYKGELDSNGNATGQGVAELDDLCSMYITIATITSGTFLQNQKFGIRKSGIFLNQQGAKIIIVDDTCTNDGQLLIGSQFKDEFYEHTEFR